MKNRVDGHQSLFKDSISGVIVNREDSDRSRYQLAKRQAYENIDSKRELADVRQELDEIKSLLKQILNN